MLILPASNTFSREAEGTSTPKELSETALTHLRRVQSLMGMSDAEIEEKERSEQETLRTQGFTPRKLGVEL